MPPVGGPGNTAVYRLLPRRPPSRAGVRLLKRQYCDHGPGVVWTLGSWCHRHTQGGHVNLGFQEVDREGEGGLHWAEENRDGSRVGVKAQRQHGLEWCKLQIQ